MGYSVILSPEPGDIVSSEQCKLQVRGVAYNGGTCSDIARVEVSANRGQSWQEAKCLFEDFKDTALVGKKNSKLQPKCLHRGWIRFETEISLDQGHQLGCGSPLAEIWCRAFNEKGEGQPERGDAHGGYIFNGYHKVPL